MKGISVKTNTVSLLQRHGLSAKKKYGQNFLIDSNILKKIVTKANVNSDTLVVEIGPGLGALTEYLLEKAGHVLAYEIDSDLVLVLKELFQKPSFTLIEGDILKIDLEELVEREFKGKKIKVAANLPYYIATTIILKALKDPLCKSMVVMIQKEVAKKFSAPCRTKEFTSLAILAKSIAKAEILFDVLPESFEPSPKVTSSVLKIEKEKNFIGNNGIFKSKKELDDFERYLRYSFNAPRKTWLKNISAWIDKTKASSILQKYEYPVSIRPHEISVSSHHLLFKELRYEDGREETRDKTSFTKE